MMRKLGILILDGLLSSFRSKKAILFLALYLGTFFIFCYGFIKIEEKIVHELEKQGINETSRKVLSSTVKKLLREKNDELVVDFLLTVPYFNTALFILSIFCTPLLILLLRYDVPAREIYDGTLRFLTFRVSRGTFILARFLGGVIEFALITLAAQCAAILWVKAKIPLFPAGESFKVGFVFWVRLQFFFAVFIAFALLVSVIVKKPFLALLVAVLGLLALFIIPIWIDYVSPFDIEYIGGLFYSPSPRLYRTLGAYLGFAVLFLGIGAAVFQRKNL